MPFTLKNIFKNQPQTQVKAYDKNQNSKCVVNSGSLCSIIFFVTG
jgi:hypothetical protein